MQIACLLLAVLALFLALTYGFARSRNSASSDKSAEPTPVQPAAMGTDLAAHEERAEETNSRLDAMNRLLSLALDAPTAQPFDDVALHEELASRIRWTLASITDKPNYAPRRPLLLPKLIQAMNDDDVSRGELTAIIASDPSLAGSLLRLANSTFYRVTSEPVESLNRAVALLGIMGMRSLVLAALMQPVFQAGSGGFANFGDITWQHTLYSAAAAESHTIMLESSDPFVAQLLALMMGMATIIVFRVTVDEYQARKVPVDCGVLAMLILTQTGPVARQMATSWQLSERAKTALTDQTGSIGAVISSLGRSLQFGRFLGALGVLHERRIIDDESVSAALQTGGPLANTYERIWAKHLSLSTPRHA